MKNVAVVLILSALVAGCGKKEPALQGGGSTFVYPLMSRWAAEYEKKGKGMIRYLSIGSGKGVEQMLDKTLAFGCTDGPLSDKELEAAKASGGEVLHIPLVLGAVVPAYNLEGVSEPLQFTGQVLAEIFMGKISRWNDAALADINPGVKLPDKAIHVVHRLDSSGTTYIWTEYLSLVNPQWKETVGTGKEVRWLIGLPGKGNDGVAGLIKSTPNSIGYVELTYGTKESLTFGSVKNRDGHYVTASPASVSAAVEALKTIPDDLRFTINNASGAKAYPISGCTWAVVYAKQTGQKGKQVADFLRWATTEGMHFGEKMGYAQLPPVLASKRDAQLERIQVEP